MKTSHAILTALLTVCLSSCVIGSKPKVVTPPAPQPAPAPPPPAAPPQPLSLPQTQVQLPPDQPPDPAAFVVETTAAQPETSPPTRPAKPKPKPAAPPATVAEPPAPPAAAADAQPEERGPAHEILSQAEINRLKNNADKLKRDIRGWLAGSKAQKLDSNDPTVARIKSLMLASDQAEEKGDMREASDLAEHAMGFLRELQGAR